MKNMLSSEVTLKSGKKYNSPEEVRIALGFMAWHEYRKNIKESAKNSDLPPEAITEIVSKNRRTGRTTEMLVDCLYHAQFEKIMIAGFPHKYGESLVQQAKGMCGSLGIDPENIFLASTRESLRGVRCFFDNSVDNA